jgi:alpha-tubulin suppressor-like RCC1 family protein
MRKNLFVLLIGILYAYSVNAQCDPTPVWTKIANGFYHSAAIKSDGTLWTWGQNTYGQLGDGTTVSKSSPVKVGFDANWIDVACGAFYTVGIKSNGEMWAWGNNCS